MEDDKHLTIAAIKCGSTEDTSVIQRRAQKRLFSHSKKSKDRLIKIFPEILAKDVKSVFTSSAYVVVLMKDGRVCRFLMKSRHQPISEPIRRSVPKKPMTMSLQVASDERYARQLQQIFDHQQISPDYDYMIHQPFPSLMDSGTLFGPLSSDVAQPFSFIERCASNSSSHLHDVALDNILSFRDPLIDDLLVPNVDPLVDGPPLLKLERLDSGVLCDSVDVVSEQENSRTSGCSSSHIRDVPPGSVRKEKGRSHLSAKPKPLSSEGSKRIKRNDMSFRVSKFKKNDLDNYLDFGPIEWLTAVQVAESVEGECPLFDAVAVMHSEILLVSKEGGFLYHWPCVNQGGVSKARPHPLTESLNLGNGGIYILKSSNVRASVVLKTGEIATFYDPILREISSGRPPPLISELTHSAQVLQGLKPSVSAVESLFVSDFITIATTKSGKSFWWGLVHQGEENGGNVVNTDSSSSSSEIKVGCSVKLKDGPKYGCGTLVYRNHPLYGPQVGKTTHQVDQASIDSGSMVVNVLSDPSAPSPVVPIASVWGDNPIYLLEDLVPILGKVIGIDNNQAVVDLFQNKDPSSTKAGLRIIKISQLELVDSNEGSPKPSTPQESKGSAKPPPECRHHAAGIVQKQPVCFIDATQDISSDSLFDTGLNETVMEDVPVITGFKLICASFNEEKPLFLLQRVSDDKCFLIASAKASLSLLQSSSFVAMGTGNSQIPKCSLEMEAADGVGCGLIDTTLKDLWKFYCSELNCSSNDHSTASLQLGSKRKQATSKSLLPVEKEYMEGQSELHCSMSSKVVLLRDAKGGVHFLNDGLSLKSCSSSSQSYNVPVLSSLNLCVRALDCKTSYLLCVHTPYSSDLYDALTEEKQNEIAMIFNSLEEELAIKQRKRRKGKEKLGGSTAPKRRKGTTEHWIADEETLNQEEPLSWSDLFEIVSPLLATGHGNHNTLHVCCSPPLKRSGSSPQRPSVGNSSDNMSVADGSGDDGDVVRSFEEARNEFYIKRKELDTAEEYVSPKFDFLKKLLSTSSSTISAVVKYLLCSKNSSGCTPFLWALKVGNHKAALAILEYVLSQSVQPSDSTNLLEGAILQTSGDGLTPLQLFFKGFVRSSLSYDLEQKILRVFDLPPGITAQQLMTIFRSYYPSVYRVEVCDDGDEKSDKQDSTSDSDSDSGDVYSIKLDMFKGPDGHRQPSDYGNFFQEYAHPTTRASRRRVPSVRRRCERHMLGGLATPVGTESDGCKANVYFNDVHQLRAASQEMQNHQVSVNRIRASNWGSSHMLRTISVEVDSYVEESSTEQQDGRPYAYNLLHQELKPSNQKVTLGEATRKVKGQACVSSLKEISKVLLKKMLEVKEILALKDAGDDTLISSLICNKSIIHGLMHKSGAKKPVIASVETGRSDTSQPSSRDMQRRQFIHFAQHFGLTPTSFNSTETERGGRKSSSPLSTSESSTTLLPPSPLTQNIKSASTTRKSPDGDVEMIDMSKKGIKDYVVLEDEDQSATDEDNNKDDGDAQELPTISVDSSTDFKLSFPTSFILKDDPKTAGLVTTVFSNWQCVLVTVLGYCPSSLSGQSDESPSLESSDQAEATPTAGHVILLDQFLIKLLYSGYNGLIQAFFTTILNHMNTSLSNPDVVKMRKSTSSSKMPLTENTAGLVVGEVVLRALLRILTMEHSKPNVVNQSSPSTNVSSVSSFDPLSSAGRSRRHSERSYEIYQLLKRILVSFSAFTIEAMTSSCSALMAPVSNGLAKPLSAASVCVEYQKNSYRQSTSYSLHPPTLEGREREVGPTPHIRSSTCYHHREGSTATLPLTGIRLQPRVGLSGDDGQMDILMDFGTEGDQQTSKPNPLVDLQGYAATRGRTAMYEDTLTILDEDSSSESEAEILHIHDMFPVEVGAHQGDDTVYQYAWALDGRMMGESQNRITANHPDVIDAYMDPRTLSVNSIPSIRFGAGFLARTSARLLKDLVDLMEEIVRKDKKSSNEEGIQLPDIKVPPSLKSLINQNAIDTLEPSWEWIVQAMDVAEGQLQQGSNFDTLHYVQALRATSRNGSNLSGNGGNVQLSGNRGSSFVGSSPAEYACSLLRCSSGESNGTLPVLDLFGYEHVVYALDGFLYALTKSPFKSPSAPPPGDKVQGQSNSMDTSSINSSHLETNEVNSTKDDSSVGSYHSFFERSLSVGVGGSPVRDDVSSEAQLGSSFSKPVSEEYPMAHHPHLLSMQVTSSPKRAVSGVSQQEQLPQSLSSKKHPKNSLLNWNTEKIIQRWRTAISVFAHIFLVEGPGNERDNFLYAHAGIASRMARFRHQVNVLRESPRDLGSGNNTLTIRIRRSHLLQDGLDLLKNLTVFKYGQVRVRFEGEDGSGPGVNRGFFTAFANALKSAEKLKGGKLLHEPGKLPEQAALYAPLPSTNEAKKEKEERKHNFIALGRFIGLCLWFKQTVPLVIGRHVAKFLLGRELAWHDVAFFNSDLYEGLRRMLLDVDEGKKSREDFLSTYCCYFEAQVGGKTVELLPGGAKTPVTPERVKEYVKLYAMLMMVDCVKSELTAMKKGLLDIIPPDLLNGITAEDFQLLLSGGSENITVKRLKSCIRFQHSHSGSESMSQRFEKMFWKVVGQMNNSQRQQLLYFATGSSALPLQGEGTTSPQIVIDVIGGNLESLPIASTCSQRISLPLYPSYHILRKKLLQSIQCQSYGLA